MEYSFTVLIDTQERKPWELSSASILGTKYQKLKTGDYTIEGYEDLLCIERKASITELAININESRFPKFLERMSKFKYKYIVLESNMEELINFPHQSNLPQSVLKKIRVNGKYLLKCLTRMEIKYGINIIYCNSRENAQLVAINIMKEVLELEYVSKNKTN